MSAGESELPDFSRRIPQLDGLRGIAILLVLLYHYVGTFILADRPSSFPPLAICWCGVDLFFVLSGFLIGGILLDARGSANYFRVFYARRVCRIFPLYLAFLLVVAFASRFGLAPVVPWKFSILFLQNVWMAAHPSLSKLMYPMSPTWSLAVEEQFYLTLPAVICFVKPKHLPKVLAGAIFAAPAIRAALFLRAGGFGTYLLLPCRMDSLLIGVGTAWLVRQPGAAEFLSARRRQLWTAIELLSAVCAIYCFRPIDDLFSSLVIYDSLAFLFACSILVSLVDGRAQSILRMRWLMGLGHIAYGTYLIHSLVAYLVLIAFPTIGPLLMVLVAAVLTVGVAKLSWEFFEKPIVKFGHRLNYRPAPPQLAAQAAAAD